MSVLAWSEPHLLHAEHVLRTLVPHCYKAPADDAVEWSAVDRGVRGVELPFYATVLRAHLATVRVIAAQLAAQHALSTIMGAAQQVLRPLLARAGAAHFPVMLRHGWVRALNQLTARQRRSVFAPTLKAPRPQRLGVPFDLDWPAVLDYIAARPLQYAPAAAHSTITLFRRLLEAGFREGLGSDEIARTIVREELPGISRTRATVIARTETISATNRGAHESYRASGVVEKKQWLNSHDARVRRPGPRSAADHRFNGIVPIDEPFTLPSGAKLMYPGDLSLGAPLSETVQCRCALRPVVNLVGVGE